MNHPNLIADVQALEDRRELAIDKVGIKSVRHPVRVADRSPAGAQHTIATFDMYVGLPHHTKGTHMSRFLEILNAQEQEISAESFEPMLRNMLRHLEARSGQIEMRFPYFLTKTAPVSGVKSLLDYEASFIGEIDEHSRYSLTLRVVVPVTSLCPCSKKISAYGAHNQRSHITLSAQAGNARVWLEDLIEIAESEASCEVFGLLKRPDEKFVTERAYDNPKFVEDLVRDVAGRLNADARIIHYIAEAENFESIHNHSAYARIERDKRNPA